MNQMTMFNTEALPETGRIMTKNEFLGEHVAGALLQDRIRDFGPERLLTEEYISLMTGIDVEKAREYIGKYGLTELVRVSDSLDITPRQRIRLLLLYETCRRIGADQRKTVRISSPDDAGRLFVDRLRFHAVEILAAAFLDNRNQVICVEELGRGTQTEVTASPGMLVKMALRHNATGVILAHNHPSGVAEPSSFDRITTERVRDALKLVSISLLDHIIVGDSVCTSLKEMGIL